jgi:hypothetical protein
MTEAEHERQLVGFAYGNAKLVQRPRPPARWWGPPVDAALAAETQPLAGW